MIGFFILLIACFNFMNLFTAQSSKRAKEVGLKKVVGSNRLQLVVQFLGESLIMTIISSLLAILIVEMLLPYVNQFLEISLHIEYLNQNFIFSIMTIVILTGIIAGSYPSLFLSSFKPIKILSGDFSSGLKGANLRRILVITQFSLSIGLIICTAVIFRQMNYIQNKKLGFDKENVVYIPITKNIGEKYDVVKHQLLNNPNIIAVTAKDFLGTGLIPLANVNWEGKKSDAEINMVISNVELRFN